ncbi:MAG TPA: hypothetical protein PKJ77_01145 [Thermodesulfobacteriota bacterium]|nr:hypothetical protein [Deltaproteobacteria bacterium]HNR13226.1 hypothetical protein [Thermodesulfobacteriota bacterium]HNU70871.1 hypothetical protein [Thermodesulfobacteriota bacterium]HOC37868.1 hypothetical protein [Thermodesulfobacteriota bacterium]
MLVLTFVIAVAALVVAILAYQRAAGAKDMDAQLSSLRARTADALAKMERSLRKQGPCEGGDDKGPLE